jgi:hypothetical protein
VFSPASSQRASVSCAAPMPPSAAAFIIANLPAGGGIGRLRSTDCAHARPLCLAEAALAAVRARRGVGLDRIGSYL